MRSPATGTLVTVQGTDHVTTLGAVLADAVQASDTVDEILADPFPTIDPRGFGAPAIARPRRSCSGTLPR
jgi:hypothetical protein